VKAVPRQRFQGIGATRVTDVQFFQPIKYYYLLTFNSKCLLSPYYKAAAVYSSLSYGSQNFLPIKALHCENDASKFFLSIGDEVATF
jgi:hypothetical protein